MCVLHWYSSINRNCTLVIVVVVEARIKQIEAMQHNLTKSDSKREGATKDYERENEGATNNRIAR